MRETGAFYRFRACTATMQARSEKCSARDFGYDLDGLYVADGGAFDEDCVLQCADNSNRHSVRVNATRVGAGNVSVWRARVCLTCTEDSWPVFANGSRLPRVAFGISLSCVSTCMSSAGFACACGVHTPRVRMARSGLLTTTARHVMRAQKRDPAASSGVVAPSTTRTRARSSVQTGYSRTTSIRARSTRPWRAQTVSSTG